MPLQSLQETLVLLIRAALPYKPLELFYHSDNVHNESRIGGFNITREPASQNAQIPPPRRAHHGHRDGLLRFLRDVVVQEG